MGAGTMVGSPSLHGLVVHIIAAVALAGVALSCSLAVTAGVAADSAGAPAGVAGSFAVTDSATLPFTLFFVDRIVRV